MKFDEFFKSTDELVRNWIFKLSVEELENLFFESDSAFEGFSTGPMYIFPNGDICSAEEYHTDILGEVIQKHLLRIYSDQVEDKGNNISEQINDIKCDSFSIAENILNEITNHFGIIRINGGKSWDERFYTVLPHKLPSNPALYTFEDIFDKTENKNFLVFVLKENSSQHDSKTFSTKYFDGNDMVRIIRRYYATGNFNESVENKNNKFSTLLEKYINKISMNENIKTLQNDLFSKIYYTQNPSDLIQFCKNTKNILRILYVIPEDTYIFSDALSNTHAHLLRFAQIEYLFPNLGYVDDFSVFDTTKYVTFMFLPKNKVTDLRLGEFAEDDYWLEYKYDFGSFLFRQEELDDEFVKNTTLFNSPFIDEVQPIDIYNKQFEGDYNEEQK